VWFSDVGAAYLSASMEIFLNEGERSGQSKLDLVEFYRILPGISFCWKGNDMCDKSNVKGSLGAWLILLIVPAVSFAGKTIYVDDDANGLNNGTSWQNAYKFLQDALADANAGENPVEIIVAQGIYRPDRRSDEPNGTGHRKETFELINGVTIKGGYAGFGQPDPNARDIDFYETVLSGDLNGDDIDVNGPSDLLDEPTRAENSYHVVTGSGTDKTAVLDGLIIIGGHANESSPLPSPYESGGGMYNKYGSPTITNCIFQENSANYGGAIYNYEGSPLISNTLFDHNFTFTVCWGDVCSPGTGSGIYNDESSTKLENCTFTQNSTTDGRGGGIFNKKGNHVIINCIFTANSADSGGAVYNSRVTNIALTGCLFTENSGIMGGAVWNERSTTFIIRCTFSSNLGGLVGGVYNWGSISTINDSMFNRNLGDAGGVCNYQSNATLTNCTFTGNRARRQCGGAILNTRCTPILTNCTIVGNRAGQAGGGVCNSLGGNAILRNCILWGNTAPNGSQIALKETSTSAEPSTITVCYSAVLGGREAVYVGPGCSLNWVDGNIDADPCYADSGHWDPNGTPWDPNDDFWVDGDYHLKSQAGRWEPLIAGWIKDDVTSPCIDAGDPKSPIGLEPFPNGGIINMGAYGGTIEASKSYFGKPPCETIVAGDINGDCIVNLKDFALMAYHWLEDNR
jgi:hypothetical protein